MKKLSTKESRVLLLLQLDAQRIFERIKYREIEYMRIFSYRRTREHFKDIFRNRYDECSLEYLAFVSEEVIASLDQFYTKVEELRWYLMNTEDMPATVSDNVSHAIFELHERYETLQLYLNAELGVTLEKAPIVEEVGEVVSSESSNDDWRGDDLASLEEINETNDEGTEAS
ncbi:MAG: hypothetical protein COW00_00035 [Bdellovibrio sp. CG12_big_fil_rev_8_21_14_0_65_39_13]|nr:MAG: hypothetical protein COW78_11025 [Bdellovibrio sp. CG22_combo_CG10-13_8_21_14_all_39_27]PIQ63049.1 MAG: hypothetical protein COW00_00035 [Bdellovibrio sp. CG12_big_fil_rev_8_21_14_0_65_39_13]PIR35739.1 MAG: hypothetical protein COV37_06965 [Bdellovibrio sp. CG11_big_fil_rev_8_21_14_0_20_39_38]